MEETVTKMYGTRDARIERICLVEKMGEWKLEFDIYVSMKTKDRTIDHNFEHPEVPCNSVSYLPFCFLTRTTRTISLQYPFRRSPCLAAYRYDRDQEHHLVPTYDHK